jgi:hypothetical protein
MQTSKLFEVQPSSRVTKLAVTEVTNHRENPVTKLAVTEVTNHRENPAA